MNPGSDDDASNNEDEPQAETAAEFLENFSSSSSDAHQAAAVDAI